MTSLTHHTQDKATEELVQEYAQLQREARALDARLKELRAELLRRLQEGSHKLGRVQVTVSVVRRVKADAESVRFIARSWPQFVRMRPALDERVILKALEVGELPEEVKKLVQVVEEKRLTVKEAR